MESRVDLPALAEKCLSDACTFVATLKINTAVGDLKKQLLQWWEDDGQTLVLGSIDEDLDLEDFSDEEDEAPVADAEEESLEQNIASAKAGALINGELLKLQAETDAVPNPEDANPDEPLDEKSGAEEEPEAYDAQPTDDSTHVLKPDQVFTLADVLLSAGFSEYSPEVGDKEWPAMKRARALLPHLKNFVSRVRLFEKVLQKASIFAPTKLNHHNWLEHQLSQARQAFACSSARQSRHQLWQGYHERVLKDVQTSDEGSVMAQTPQTLGPPSIVDDDARGFQLFVVRPFKSAVGCDGLRFALPMSVWRCGKSGSGRGRKLMATGKMPLFMCSHAHMLLLTPIQNGEDLYFVGTFLGYFGQGLFLMSLEVFKVHSADFCCFDVDNL